QQRLALGEVPGQLVPPGGLRVRVRGRRRPLGGHRGDVPPRGRRGRRHRPLRRHVVAVRARRPVRPVPDLPERALALRAAARRRPARLPPHVRQPRPRPQDAPVTTSERAQTMTQPDTVENGHDEAGDPGPRTGSHGLYAGIRVVLRPEPWRRGLIVAALAVLLGLLIALHAMIPNRIGNLGSLVETFLPWFGLLIPVLLAGALWRRSASATAALLLPVVAWLNLFGGHLVDKSAPGGDLTVTSHNVGADNPEPARTARALAASDADVLALQELTQQTRATYERELAAAYPHHTVQGTVGLWSKLTLSNTWPVDRKSVV